MGKKEERDISIFWELMVEAVNSQQWDRARAVGEHLLTITPDDPSAHSALGLALLWLNDLKRAEKHLRTSIGMGEATSRNHNFLAQVYARRGDLEGQLRWAKKAIECDEKESWAYLVVADAYIRMEQFTEAEATLRQVLERDPKDVEAHTILGRLYLAMEEPKKAAEEFRAVLDEEPEEAYYWANLGYALYRDGELGEALREDPYMERQESNIGLWSTANLAVSYIYQERYAEAEECLQRNVELLEFTYYNLGLAQFKQGKYEDALVNLQRALELEPTDVEYLDMLANAYMELGRLNEAKEVLELANTTDKNYALAHYDLGVVFSRMEGKQKEALQCFKRALALNKDLPWAYYSIACIHALRGDKKPAFQFLEKAFQKGFKDKEHMEKDTDLDSLRDDPKYRRLKERYLVAR